MPYDQLKKQVYRLFAPILRLDDLMSREERARIEYSLNIIVAVLFALSFVTLAINMSPIHDTVPFFSLFAFFGNKLYGALLLVFAIRFCFSAIEAFHRSYYYRGLALVLAEVIDQNDLPVSYEVAYTIHHTDDADITGGFLLSPYGQVVLMRCGITREMFDSFVTSRKPTLTATSFLIEKDRGVTIVEYARSIFKQDKDFAQFLVTHDVTREEFEGAAGWVMRTERFLRSKERWWSRDELGRIPGIGKAWSYGQVYLLEKYGHDMTLDPVYAEAGATAITEDNEVEAMEAVLSRARQSNVLLVGAEGSGKRERIAQLTHKIQEGKVFPAIEHKQVFLLDPAAMVSAAKTKGLFEEELTRVLTQAIHAGNIILVLENFPALMRSAQAIGTNIVDFLTPYFESSAIQILITADPEGLHRDLETNAQLMQYFDVVQMHDVDDTAIVRILEQTALRLEARALGSVVVTYPALLEVVKSADRYFPDGVMPDKALDLLAELVPTAQAAHKDYVLKSDVEELIEQKTGVPTGAIGSGEQKKLLNLEDLIKKRVVGQTMAIEAIAKAMRRSRAGVRNEHKPIGSFLFLGPTGVGKTETAKALAEAYFNDEGNMLRLDMSEFQTPDALERLIGSAEGRPGRLASMLREKQFGVLLLDEFEKTNHDVLDLFLQILDEGQFTDSAGKKVSARDLIIIATSNAAADKIWEWFTQGQDVATKKQDLITEVVSRGVFRPELLNRFDDIILFHPLTPDEIRKIAQLQLAHFARQMHDKGVEFIVTDSLVDAIAKIGYDPKFGGRPMNRAIEEHVQQVVADRMIRGEVKAGDTVTLTGEDIGESTDHA